MGDAGYEERVLAAERAELFSYAGRQRGTGSSAFARAINASEPGSSRAEWTEFVFVLSLGTKAADSEACVRLFGVG